MNITKVKYESVVIGDKINFKMDGEKSPVVRTVTNVEKVGSFLQIVFDTFDTKGHIDSTIGFPESELNKIN